MLEVDKEIESSPVPAAVWLRATVWVALAALSVITNEAVAVPARAGVAVTQTVQDIFGAIARPQLLVSVKLPETAPLIAMLERISGAVPVFVTTKGKVAPKPTVTVLKFKLDALRDTAGLPVCTPSRGCLSSLDGVWARLSSCVQTGTRTRPQKKSRL